MSVNKINQIWWHRPVIPAFRRWRQEDLGYIVSSRPAWATEQGPVTKIQKQKELLIEIFQNMLGTKEPEQGEIDPALKDIQ